MMNLISRAIGVIICLALMLVGAKHTAKKLWSWKVAHDARQPVIAR